MASPIVVLPMLPFVFTVIWIGENSGDVVFVIVSFFIVVVGVVCCVIRQFVSTVEAPPPYLV